MQPEDRDGISPADIARLKRITGVATIWDERCRKGLAVERGSELGYDDELLPDLSLSHIASWSMTVSSEHLNFTTTVIDKTLTIYPTAYMTGIRTALLTASHAVFVLTPDDRKERQRNALKLETDDVRTQLIMVRNTYTESSKTAEAKAELVARLEARQKRLQELATDLGLTTTMNTFQLNNTDLIRDTAASTHDENLVRAGVSFAWRMGSTAAHGGRSYSTMSLKPGAQKTTNTGKPYIELSADFGDIMTATQAATLALNEAFRLWELRANRR